MYTQNKHLLYVGVAILSLVAVRTAHGDGGDGDVSADAAVQEVVNINTASVEQLRLLPGVGPSTAEAIVRLRNRRPFTRKEQLLKVKGIGPKTLRRLRPYLVLEGSTTLTQKVRLRR